MEKSRLEKLKELYDRLIPPFARLPLWLMLFINTAGYELFKLMSFGRGYHDLTVPLDNRVPILPWTAIIYFASFVFWFFGYIVAARIDEKKMYRFFSTDVAAKLFCFLIFVILPTGRERPPIPEDAPVRWLLELLYFVDTPTGLFPSLHCLNSWICFMGVRGEKSVPLWYKIFAALMSVAIFISTLTTAQHVIVDVFAGVAVGEIFWLLSKHTPLPRLAERFLVRAQRVKEKFFDLFRKKKKAGGGQESQEPTRADETGEETGTTGITGKADITEKTDIADITDITDKTGKTE